VRAAWALVLLGLLSGLALAQPTKPERLCSEQKQWLRKVEQNTDWEEVKLPGVRVAMPYATPQNITGRDLYCGIQKAYLNKAALAKLRATAEYLRQKYGIAYGLLIFDAGRGRHAQAALRAVVEDTPYERFVSRPEPGSIHAYGMAVDLTLTLYGKPLDMGLPFDSFEECAGREREEECLRSGKLSTPQVANREMLREVMRHGGWINLPSEWWHFNAGRSEEIREKYPKIN
jgi:D-alanyl-D-alanine dipeptidase